MTDINKLVIHLDTCIKERDQLVIKSDLIYRDTKRLTREINETRKKIKTLEI